MATVSDLHPLETLRRLFGARVADDFRASFAGASIRIPLTIPTEHPIAKAIGYVKAQALASECGGVTFTIPTGKPEAFRDRLTDLVGQGLTNNEIALRLGVTERHVCAQRSRYGLRRRDLATSEAAT
jgi:hypothetical protein